MQIIRLPEEYFGCTHKEIAGIYLTITPEDPNTPPDLYVRWIYRNAEGQVLPGKSVDKIAGGQLQSFMQMFQFNAGPVLQWSIDNGYSTGAVEEV